MASSFKKIDGDRKELTFISQNDFDYKDFFSIANVLDKLKPKIVINCAAYTFVDLAETEKEKCEKLNYGFVIYVADWCAQNDCKLIHFSTDYVFDGKKQEEYQEEDPVCPINWYGTTKAMSEEYLLKSNVHAVIFRISWVYSEFGNNFLKTMIRLGKEKDSLNIVSDQIGSPCYAVNVAEVIYDWIFKKGLKNFTKEIYHLVPNAQLSWFDFAKEIFSVYKSKHHSLRLKQLTPILTKDYRTAASRPLNSRMNSEKALKNLGLCLEDIHVSLGRAINELHS